MGILFMLLLALALVGVQADNNGLDENVYNELFKDGKYDKRIRPNARKGAVSISVTMYFISATDFSEKDARLTTEFYFRQSWQDPRLTFTGVTDYLIGGEELDDLIWKPDTFIPGTMVDLRKSNHVFVRIRPDGQILRSVMVRASTKCPLNLWYFPFDTQVCPIDFESYGLNSNDILYRWQLGENSVGFSANMEVQDKIVLATRIVTTDIYLTTGNYSRIQVNLMLSRNPSHFIRNYYGPAIVFAMITWLTFWMPVASIFRGVCLLASVVSHWTLLSRVGDILPWSQHSTSLDQYLVTCLVLSVLALTEHFLLTFLQNISANDDVHKNNNVQLNEKETLMDPLKNEECSMSYIARSKKYIFSWQHQKKLSSKINLSAKIMYATVFIVYNLWYWVSFPEKQV